MSVVGHICLNMADVSMNEWNHIELGNDEGQDGEGKGFYGGGGARSGVGLAQRTNQISVEDSISKTFVGMPCQDWLLPIYVALSVLNANRFSPDK